MIGKKRNARQPDAKTGEQEDRPVEDSSTSGDQPPVEIGGRDGPDPTRFGDWEKNGRCIDF